MAAAMSTAIAHRHAVVCPDARSAFYMKHHAPAYATHQLARMRNIRMSSPQVRGFDP